jgi:hypothetical protein
MTSFYTICLVESRPSYGVHELSCELSSACFWVLSGGYKTTVHENVRFCAFLCVISAEVFLFGQHDEGFG